MDESAGTEWAHDAAVVPAGTRRTRARWLGPALVMGGVWGLIDLSLETLNQATGVVGPLRPLSFLVGPTAAIVAGTVLGIRGRRDWILSMALALGTAFLALFGFVLLSGSAGMGSGAGLTGLDAGGGYSTVDIGTGGDGCQIEHQGRAFVVGEPVRASAEIHPAISKGTEVTITLRRDGEMETGYPVVQIADSNWECVYGDVAFEPLRAGHYRWELSTADLPPVGGEFDVSD